MPGAEPGTTVKPMRIGDILELAYGKFLPKRLRRGGDVPVYGSGGLIGWHDEAVVGQPTVIVGRQGTAGSVSQRNLATRNLQRLGGDQSLSAADTELISYFATSYRSGGFQIALLTILETQMEHVATKDYVSKEIPRCGTLRGGLDQPPTPRLRS